MNSLDRSKGSWKPWLFIGSLSGTQGTVANMVPEGAKNDSKLHRVDRQIFLSNGEF